MLTSNLDIADRLINRQLGTIFDFQYLEGTITKIYVAFDEFSAGIIKRDSDNFAKVNDAASFERIELDLKLTKSSTIFAKHTQFLIMLTWACTIHKVQGLTIANLAITLQPNKQTTFGADKFYVAVSHEAALSKVSLIGYLKNVMIKASASALLEYDRQKKIFKFLFCT